MRTLTRERAIEELRTTLLELVDEEHSMCETAARHGIYCRGFRQYSDEELRKRYEWLALRAGASTRAELEDLANRWQLARQLVRGAALSCDVQTCEHDTCSGWDGFSDETLAQFHKQLRGEEIQIVGRGA